MWKCYSIIKNKFINKYVNKSTEKNSTTNLLKNKGFQNKIEQ